MDKIFERFSAEELLRQARNRTEHDGFFRECLGKYSPEEIQSAANTKRSMKIKKGAIGYLRINHYNKPCQCSSRIEEKGLVVILDLEVCKMNEGINKTLKYINISDGHVDTVILEGHLILDLYREGERVLHYDNEAILKPARLSKLDRASIKKLVNLKTKELKMQANFEELRDSLASLRHSYGETVYGIDVPHPCLGGY